ncbi:MAG: DUF1579 family protein [Planctomycetes bacterium]|nr:DUF1579 family protein [Planctomycetota bacterium]
MTTRLRSLLLTACSLLVVAAAPAQDHEYDTTPAKELSRLKPLIGNWQGTGKMVEPTGVETPWTARGTYRWVLNGHFVQEDFVIAMEGLPVPMVFRNYIGWDREHGRYVAATLSNEGSARLNETQFLPDGTMLTTQTHHMAGVPYNERARVKIDGDSMTMRIDLLMAEGDSIAVIDSVMKRGGDGFDGDWGVGPWMGAKPAAAIDQLARMAGTYETKGEMVMMPGTPAIGIHGSDTWQMVFGGMGMFGRTDGHAEGSPDAYVSFAMWGWDEHGDCMNAVYVDNMGQVGEMQARWHEGKLISTMAGVQMGMPMTQRYIMEVDDAGVATRAIGHSVFGAMEPFLSFKATYTKKK